MLAISQIKQAKNHPHDHIKANNNRKKKSQDVVPSQSSKKKGKRGK
jgi:hypothetical protein